MKILEKLLQVKEMMTQTDFNIKVVEIEAKILSLNGLAITSALTAVESKIPNVSSFVKNADYNTKISEIENKVNDHNQNKYITTPEFNTLAADVFNARLAAKTDLIRKPESDFRLKSISDKVTKNETKHLLVENELKI